MLERLTVDLNPDSPKFNPKQRQFFDVVMKAASTHQQYQIAQKKLEKMNEDDPGYDDQVLKVQELGEQTESGFRRLHFGGAIRGAKTFTVLTLAVILCQLFPGMRCHVVRKSFPVLVSNAVKSLEKILKYSEGVYWKRHPSEYFCQFPNGSRIYFAAESFAQDKQLTKFLGLETNIIIFEQLEEIQEKSYDIICSRAGSHYSVRDGIMPPAFVFTTFNPTPNWVKKKIYDKWKTGSLPEDEYFCESLPSDNPHVTDDQNKQWEKLDPDTYDRLIKAIWDVKATNQFFQWFNKKQNITDEEIPINLSEHIILSFDFNVDPMTAIMCQTDGATYMHVIQEFRIENGDTYSLCENIKPIISGLEHLVIITGDASGSNRMSGTRGHINHYQIIMSELDLKVDQFRVPTTNPFISDSRVFMNSLFYKLPVFLIHSSCEYLIRDLKFLEVSIDKNGNMGINKTGINESLQMDNKEIGHLSDCLRYACHSMLYDFLKIPKS